jgi:hypothetical protein
MSALLYARGLVGPAGRICMVDSENGRGSIFADIIPGGYSVVDIEPPFSPERYSNAIEAAETNADVVVVDSLSQEWSGEGGVLDMADAELERMGGGDKNKMRSWIKPKMAHKFMVMRLLRCRLPLICCIRGEEKTHMIEGRDGKKVVITDEFSSPLFDQRFIFEMLLSLETVAREGVGGFVIPRKITHPSIAGTLPKTGEQIVVKHGEAMRAWCANPGVAPSAVAPVAPPDPIKALKAELWGLLRKSCKDPTEVVNWLNACKIMPDGKGIGDLTADELAEVVEKTKIQLKDMQ